MNKIKKHADPQLAATRCTQVLDAAADCFRRKGYHGAGMAEISKTAGMSAGHIYNYFTSKEAIIEAIIQRDMEEMFSVFNRFESQPGDLLDALVNGADEGVEKNLNPERSALQLEMLAEAARNPKIAALLQASDRQARARMRELLTGPRGLQQENDLEAVDGCIEVLFSVFGGLLGRSILNPDLSKLHLLKALRPLLRQLLGAQTKDS
jgi:TetR/AcrR family transcriptional regulator, repressor for uid operon